MNNVISYFIGLVVAVLLQVLLFNGLSLYGGVVFIYLVALIKMPLQVNYCLQIIIGFLAGLMVDLFCNTHGMHAFASCTLMLLRPRLFYLFVDKEVKALAVNASQIGITVFQRYAITIITLFVVLLYLIESFTLFNLDVVVVKALISVTMTWIFAVIWEITTISKKE